MRRSTLGGIRWVSLLLCGVGFVSGTVPVPAEEAEASDGFKLTIETSRKQWFLGETPKVVATIHNNGNEAVKLVPSLDGSANHRRYPHVSFTVVSPEGASLSGPKSFCGNMNNITPENFQSVPVGGTFNPLQGWTRLREMQFPAPGIYRIQLTYDTRGEPKRWYGFMGPLKQERKINQLLADVPRMVLTSNTLEVEIVGGVAKTAVGDSESERPDEKVPESTFELLNTLKASGAAESDAGVEKQG